jgi:hypothetical protein
LVVKLIGHNVSVATTVATVVHEVIQSVVAECQNLKRLIGARSRNNGVGTGDGGNDTLNNTLGKLVGDS